MLYGAVEVQETVEKRHKSGVCREEKTMETTRALNSQAEGTAGSRDDVDAFALPDWLVGPR